VAAPLPRTDVKYPKAQGYGARIGDLFVRLAPFEEGNVRYYTRDSLAERQDQKGSFFENVLDQGYSWAKTEWSGGEGLDWDPKDRTLLQGEVNLDRIRFWDSRLMDISLPPAGLPYTLNIATMFQDWVGTVVTQINDMTASSEHLYFADGDVVRWYDSWTNDTETNSDDLGVTVFHIAAAPNGSVMASGNDGKLYFKRFDVDLFTEVLDPLTAGRPQVAGIWFVKGRFIVGLSNTSQAELLEVTPAADGLSVTDVVIDTAVGIFYSVVNSGPALVAACSDGTVRTYTPFLDSSDPAAVGQLIPRGRWDLPSSEIPILLGDIEGVLVVQSLGSAFTPSGGHTLLVYTAEVLDARFDYAVGGIQLIRSWDGTENFGDPNQEMVTTRDELFFNVQEHDDDLGQDQNYLWRFSAVTKGLSRHSFTHEGNGSDPHTKPTKCWLRFADQIGAVSYFSDVFHQDVIFYDSAFIISPNFTFGLNTDIGWVSTILEARNLESGGTIDVFRSINPAAIRDVNHPSWVLIRRLSADAQSGVEVPLTNVVSRTLALKIVITASVDGTISPELTRIGVRGIPTHRDWMVELPVNVSDLIEVYGRQPQRIPNWGSQIHNGLLTLVGKHVELEVYDPPLLFRGLINNIMEPTPWISPRGASSLRAVLEFRGDRITSTEFPLGTSGTGLGFTGIAITGVGE
jgi:hypothetical protein